jgi:hypothetical protein
MTLDTFSGSLMSAVLLISETNRIQLVLSGMQNRTSDPYLAVINRILISVMFSATVPISLPHHVLLAYFIKADQLQCTTSCSLAVSRSCVWQTVTMKPPL